MRRFLIATIELIYLIPRVFLPKKVLIPIPTFSEYEYAVKLVGGKCIFLKSKEKENFKINLDRLVENLSKVDL